MVNWQQLLWDLRRDYKPLAQIADDIGVSHKSLQKAARIGYKRMDYDIGVKLVALHQKYCNVVKINIGKL